MRAMVGTEEPVDPPVSRRPLPFSRAWLAAFVLGMIAVGWTAILIEFDTQSERAHVDRLDNVVGDIEKALADEEGYMVLKGLGDLATVTAGRSATGAEELDRMWNRVDILTKRAQTLDRTDLVALSDVVAELRSTSDELDQMVTITPSENPFSINGR